jgi:catechol 2,3-dioxygenase-like lactoylglutathione lyase family enzyme/DNA-binding CsgD family transcriptional regulator
VEGTRRGRGRPPHPDVLTPAEWRVVDGVRHGMSNRQIARGRGVSLDAVKSHVESAVAKLGLEGRGELRFWCGVPVDSALSRTETDVADSDLRLGPLGQIARAVSDIGAAEAWYRDILGLTHLYTYGKLAFFDCGGTRLFLEERSNIETSGLENDSVLYFRVEDINAAHAQLGGRGVRFLGAPHMIFKHADGTEEWMAFFNDPDGKPLAIMSQVKPAR